jgi:hypothetical protein
VENWRAFVEERKEERVLEWWSWRWMDWRRFKQADRKGRECLRRIGLRTQLESTKERRRRPFVGHSGWSDGCDEVPVLAEPGWVSTFGSGQIRARVRDNSSAGVHKKWKRLRICIFIEKRASMATIQFV